MLDGFPSHRADVADILGFIDFNSPSSVLAAWVDNIRNPAIHAPSQLKSIAGEIHAPPQFVEPLDTPLDLGKGTQALRELLEEAADAREDPDSVADDARLFKVVLPGIASNARWLGLAIRDAAMWPSMLSNSFVDAARR